jgi:hypothetical protein
MNIILDQVTEYRDLATVSARRNIELREAKHIAKTSRGTSSA